MTNDNKVKFYSKLTEKEKVLFDGYFNGDLNSFQLEVRLQHPEGAGDSKERFEQVVKWYNEFG
jgi:hypothetical protein